MYKVFTHVFVYNHVADQPSAEAEHHLMPSAVFVYVCQVKCSFILQNKTENNMTTSRENDFNAPATTSLELSVLPMGTLKHSVVYEYKLGVVLIILCT